MLKTGVLEGWTTVSIASLTGLLSSAFSVEKRETAAAVDPQENFLTVGARPLQPLLLLSAERRHSRFSVTLEPLGFPGGKQRWLQLPRPRAVVAPNGVRLSFEG